MILLRQIGAATLLLSLTLCVQCAGIATIIEWLKRVLARNADKHGPIYSSILVVKSIVATGLLHGLVIVLWASFYRADCFPSWSLALYFSASSYSTVGYGDVVLSSNWRLLGPLESITGVLMCGISISVLFALVSRLVDRDTLSSPRQRMNTGQPISAGAITDSAEQSHV